MPPSRWSDGFLESMRQVGDPAADSVIQELFARQQIDAVNQVMQALVRNDAPPPDALPPSVRQFLDQTDDLPPWADRAAIERGQELFCRYGPQVITILNCYSLPASYAARKGVQVLYRTARLATSAHRRVIETAHMIMDVMRPGGLEPGGTGVRSAQKVRLMHAAVRQLLLQRDWEPELGVPINQEDLAGSLITFGYVVVDGLRKLGVDLEPAEAEAYLHAWNAVGHVMGIREDLMPRTEAEAAELNGLIWRRHAQASPEGSAMTKALVEYIQYALPGDLFDGLPSSLIRFFLGDEGADLLGVEPADWTQRIIRPLRFLTALGDDMGDGVAPLGTLASFFGRKLIEGLCWVERGGERVQFAMPKELREAWGVSV